MIARELTEFFAGFSPNGAPALQRRGGPTFLSNVNAGYPRECWEEIRFPDVAYAEDQAFGRAMLEAGWAKVYHPGAAVYHAHDYGPVEFMQRYFDEYRGLRETIGHVEPLRPLGRGAPGGARRALDARARCAAGAARAAGLARSAVHHSGRRVGSALGSRAERLPARRPAQALARGRGPRPARERPLGGAQPVARRARAGPVRGDPAGQPRGPGAAAPTPCPGLADSAIAARGGRDPAVPARQRRPQHDLHPDRSGSRRWATPARSGCTTRPTATTRQASVLRRRIVEEFAPRARAGLQGLRRRGTAPTWPWPPAGTRPTRWRCLPGCRARAYLINDHEPEFFATSAESLWAARTYELGLYGISASRWLRDLLARRYGQRGGWFRFGVDHDIYRPRAGGAPPRHRRLLRPRLHGPARRPAGSARAGGAAAVAAPSCAWWSSGTTPRSR